MAKSKGDRINDLRRLRGDKRDKAIKDAFREGISATRIAEETGQNREQLIKKLGREGW